MRLASILIVPFLALQSSEISREEMERTIDVFSTLDRISGGPGELQAAAYLRQKLRAYGVPFEVHRMELYLSHPISASVEVTIPTRLSFPSLTHAFSASSSPDGVEGELIYIGRNMTADPFDAPLIDYEKISVRGKIVLDDGYPAPYRARATEDHGAIAQIYINPDERLHNMTVTTIWGSPTPQTEHLLPKNPIVAIMRKDGEALRKLLAGGKTVRVVVKSQVDTRWRPAELVVAKVEGGAEKDKFVLVGGHLDSWHEGVTDNATGNAAMLELARILHKNKEPLRRSVRIAWWPGHSTGRYAGSAWYADRFYDDLRQNAVAYVNIDSPGTRNATILSATHMAELEDFNVRNIEKVLGRRPRTGRPGKVADESFVGIGVSSLSAYDRIPDGSADRGVADGSGGSWWWHSREDSRDKVDLNLLVRDTDLFLTTIFGLTTPSVLPYDFRRTAAQMEERLKAIEGYNTDRLRQRVAEFGKLAERLAALEPSGIKNAPEFNSGLIRIARAINPVFYSRSGPFDQDTNELILLFPGISAVKGEDARFRAVGLRREENRIVEGLREAIVTAQRLIQ